MQVSTSMAERHSEQEFHSRLYTLADAGAGVIHVRTGEIMRCVMALRKTIIAAGNEYLEWDIRNGTRTFTVANINSTAVTGSNNPDVATELNNFINAKRTEVKDDSYQFLVCVNPQYWLEGNPVINHDIMQASYLFPTMDKRLILVTPDAALPEPLSAYVAGIRFDPPGLNELRGYLADVVDGVDSDELLTLDDDDRDRICFAGAGMAKDSFEMHAAISIVEAAQRKEDGEAVTRDDIIKGINDGKTEVVNKNDLLELYPTESMDEVGGMDNLKEWVTKRAGCYTDEAIEYGIEPPKGMVLVGVPGTGKSLVAKSVAQVFGVPLVRLDFGKVFNSLVGSSEQRMRTALRMVESMAPVVLMCDEVDKGLGGIGGSGDSGTSSRVLGSFLTWLQDCTAPVFTMVTANNVDGLPPELMRRGRFDAIFSTGFPTAEERLEVLKIHLSKRGWDPDAWTAKELNTVVVASRGYVPAEIESAVKDALIDSFSADEELEMGHVVKALDQMVPISVSFSEKIQLMTAWSKANATPASRVYEDVKDSDKVTTIGPRRTRTRAPQTDKD
jgi:ATP-dependent 26S proteasome regulatory subunit